MSSRNVQVGAGWGAARGCENVMHAIALISPRIVSEATVLLTSEAARLAVCMKPSLTKVSTD